MQQEIKYGQLWARYSEQVEIDEVGVYRINFEGLKKAIDEVIKSQQNQQGPVFVNAKDRIPDHDGVVHLKIGQLNRVGNFFDNMLGKGVYIQGHEPWTLGEEKFDGIFWLDHSPNEQPVEHISKDAHEKEVMMRAFDKVRQIFEGRQWIMEGRGSYPYNDDRYKEEVRYMYNEFDELYKNTWANIKSHSSEYRQAIIAEYLKGEQKENEAMEFHEWTRNNTVADGAPKLLYKLTNERMTTAQLYNEYQKQKNG